MCKKVLGQARDVKVYLTENHISEIACMLYRWYILNFQPISAVPFRAVLESESELSPQEPELAQAPIVNFVMR